VIPLAFTGNSKLGGVQMRGRDVADRIGVPFVPLADAACLRFRTLVLVKYWPDNVSALRQQCDRLILDPLDCWTQTKPHAEPEAFWRWVAGQTGCDAMLATSPAVQATMALAGVATILAPHAADPRIASTLHDPSGPVVYAGGERFLGDQAPAIKAACKTLGRKFVARFDRDCWQALRGAALSLCVRFGEERSPLNLVGKPLVKVANAAAAGVPVLATPDPAIESMVDVETTTGDWVSDLAAGLRSAAPVYPHSLGEYAAYLMEQLG
jgi:hypothetical protein